MSIRIILILSLMLPTLACFASREEGSGSMVGKGGNGMEAEARALVTKSIAAWVSLGVPDINEVPVELLMNKAKQVKILAGKKIAVDYQGRKRDAVNQCQIANEIYLNEKAWKSRNLGQRQKLIVHELLGAAGFCDRDESYELSNLILQGPTSLKTAAFFMQMSLANTTRPKTIADNEIACLKGQTAAEEFFALGGSNKTRLTDTNMALDGAVPLLFFAATYECPQYTEFLIKNGADVNYQTAIGKVTPLFMAIAKRGITRLAPTVVRILLNAKADPMIASQASAGGVYEVPLNARQVTEVLLNLTLAAADPKAPNHDEAVANGYDPKCITYFMDILRMLPK
jgi:hypothetical protein